jgi:hypothetical protein
MHSRTFQITLGASTKSLRHPKTPLPVKITFFLCIGKTTTDLQSYLTCKDLTNLESLFHPVYIFHAKILFASILPYKIGHALNSALHIIRKHTVTH